MSDELERKERVKALLIQDMEMARDLLNAISERAASYDMTLDVNGISFNAPDRVRKTVFTLILREETCI